ADRYRPYLKGRGGAIEKVAPPRPTSFPGDPGRTGADSGLAGHVSPSLAIRRPGTAGGLRQECPRIPFNNNFSPDQSRQCPLDEDPSGRRVARDRADLPAMRGLRVPVGRIGAPDAIGPTARGRTMAAGRCLPHGTGDSLLTRTALLGGFTMPKTE